MNPLKEEADSYLAALMRYTEGFYASAIKHGMKAGPVADSVAHVEKAARNLHQLATAGASPAVAATVADLTKENERLKSVLTELRKEKEAQFVELCMEIGLREAAQARLKKQPIEIA